MMDIAMYQYCYARENMIKHNAFISYASEDTAFSSKIVRALSAKGLKIWYAPIELKVGDKLLDSIEKGMKNSTYGILLISPDYLKKGWTNYEMDTLLRDNIENNRILLPIWHNVTKEDVENKHSGLTGIVSLSTDIGLPEVVNKLMEAMTKTAPLLGVIPSWESPKWRFLEGKGEIHLQSDDGLVTTLWEFLLTTRDQEYPLYLEDELFSKKDLLHKAAFIIPHIPEIAERAVGKDGVKRIYEMCRQIGVDPDDFA